MTGPFERSGDGFRLVLEGYERAVVLGLPGIVDAGDEPGGRLDYTAHPDDPEADRRYRELVDGGLDELRREDRSGFEAVTLGEVVEPAAIEAFVRVVGDARLVLAARIGIEDDGWERDASDDPEMAVLGWLGWLQEAAVIVLSDALEG